MFDGKYFLYDKRKIDNNDLYACMAVIVKNQQISNYKITFEIAKDLNELKQKWSWMFRDKDNEFHAWLPNLEETHPVKKDFAKHIEIFNSLIEEEVNKHLRKSNIPDIFYFSTSDIINYLKNKHKKTPSLMEVAAFKNWLLFKIAAFFEQNPEKTFEFPLYKELVNKNPQVFEQNPEYSVEDFIMDINEGILQVEEAMEGKDAQ